MVERVMVYLIPLLAYLCLIHIMLLEYLTVEIESLNLINFLTKTFWRLALYTTEVVKIVVKQPSIYNPNPIKHRSEISLTTIKYGDHPADRQHTQLRMSVACG